MRVSKAKRRWIAWCRYVDKTNSLCRGSKQRWTDIHIGQAKAYEGIMYANRYFPVGPRAPYYPKWGNAK